MEDNTKLYYDKGYGDGMDNMKRLVLMLLDENPHLTVLEAREKIREVL